MSVADVDLNSSPGATQGYTLSLTNENEAPTAMAQSNTISVLAENTAIATDRKMLDLSFTDDGIGSNTYVLSGADASFFKIVGSEVYLNAGTILDFETKSSYDVTLSVDDISLGSGPEVSSTYTLTITDVNEQPTGLSLATPAPVIIINENTAIGANYRIADITYTDDALGVETFTLSGADAAFFSIVGTELQLNVGTIVDFETKTTYDVTVNIDDVSLGGGPFLSQNFTLTVNDVNEAPFDFQLYDVGTMNITTDITLSEAAAGNNDARIKVADIFIDDDALGTNNLSVDNANFEVDATGLYWRANTNLDFEAAAIHSVNVSIDDPTFAGVEFTRAFDINVTDVAFELLSGQVTQSGADNTVTINLNESFANPVVFTFLSTDASGATPAEAEIARVSNVTANSFDLSLYDEDTNFTDAGVNETINYFVVEAGDWSITDGTTTLRLEVGLVNTTSNSTTVNYVGGAFGAAPSFISQVMTNASGDNFLNTRVSSNGTTSSTFYLEEAGLGFNNNQTVGYLAIEIGNLTNWNGVEFEAGRTPDSVTDANFTVNLANTYGIPLFFAEIDNDGGDPALVRGVSNTPTSHVVFVEEDTRSDTEVGHTTEPIYYFVIDSVTDSTDLTATALPPVVLDLNGDGVQYAGQTVLFDADSDGNKENVYWIDANDGLLAYDIGNDNIIDKTEEISFVSYLEGAQSDLEGLAAFDTNNNDYFDKGDAEWGSFKVWRDLNTDGVSDVGELFTLSDLKIRAISLQSDHNARVVNGGFEYGQAEFIYEDGSTGQLADVALNFDEYQLASEDIDLQAIALDDTANQAGEEFEDERYELVDGFHVDESASNDEVVAQVLVMDEVQELTDSVLANINLDQLG